MAAPSPFTFGYYYDEKTDAVPVPGGRLFRRLFGRLLRRHPLAELCYAGERHILLFGVNRSGKSTRLLLRNLATIQGRSIVVLDIKAELTQQTRRTRRKICGADNVKTVNPYNLDDLGSDGFNPVAILNPRDDLFYDKAKRLTLAIIEMEDDPQKFFPESAQGLLTAGIMWEVIQAKIEGRAPSLLKVRQLICERDEWEEVPPVKQGRTLVPQPPRQVKGLKINCERMSKEGGEQIAGLINRFLRDSGKNELSGIQSTFATQTEWLLSNPIARDLEKGNWSFARLRETPTTVYIILPPEELEDKRRWVKLLFTCALCEHLKPGPVSTLFILDEFRVAVAHLKIISTFWSLVAGYGVQFLVVCQSALHLKALFKEEWEIYAGQAGCVVTLGAPGDTVTAEWMSRRAGRASETRLSQNEGQGVNVQGISTSDGTTISTADVAFKTPEELMSLRVGTGRIWTPGRGNTSIPFYAPNYWKLRKARDLIDKNPLYTGPKSPPPASSSWFKYSLLRRHWRTAAAVVALVVINGVHLHNITGNAHPSPPAPVVPPVHKPGPPHVSPSPHRQR
jgi:type IV secretion system protein VirD4